MLRLRRLQRNRATDYGRGLKCKDVKDNERKAWRVDLGPLRI